MMEKPDTEKPGKGEFVSNPQIYENSLARDSTFVSKRNALWPTAPDFIFGSLFKAQEYHPRNPVV